MNDKYFTNSAVKKERVISALLTLHDIKQADIVNKLGVSATLVSLVINGKRRGVKKKGRLIRQEIAAALGMKISDLWPEKAA